MNARALLRKRQVLARTGLSESRLYDMMIEKENEKAFPRPVHIGRRAVAWVETEVDAWIEARIKARDGGGKEQFAEETRA
jgi:prophage regulatory protein